MAELRWGSATHEGQLRSQNEDHAHAGDGLFVVADGMGGHLAGEVASEIAVTRLDEHLPAGAESTLDDLVEAIAAANVEIYNGSIENPEQAGMGTTVTAIAVVSDPHDGEVFGVANVGDSRGYVLRHGRLRQITIDHSFVQELVAEGAITRDEARNHPRRNIVTRALGIEPGVRVDSWTMPIIRGDRFVLCSDGLVDEVSDETITEILRAHVDDPEAAAAALVDAANEAGGRDNVTVIVVDVLEGDDPPDPTAEFDVIPLWSDEERDLEDTAETHIVTDPLDQETLAAIDAAALAAAGVAATDATDATKGGDAAATAAPDGETPQLYDGGTDVPPVPGAKTPIVDTEAPSPPRRRRSARFARFVLALGVAAVLILGFAILAAWARSGYFVDFDEDGRVVIYQGRRESVLWFDPTEEAVGQYTRDELDEASIALVEVEFNFESQASAERFVAERLVTTTTSTTTIPASSTATTNETDTATASDAATPTQTTTTAPAPTTASATGTTTGG